VDKDDIWEQQLLESKELASYTTVKENILRVDEFVVVK
jgi:hypothetical protein